MATITPRQPFGMVTEARLRNLTNVKNQQNAILPTPAKSLKRAYVSEDSGSDNDNENVDPIILLSPSKKTKGSDGLAKPQNFFLKAAKSTSNLKTRPIATPKRLQLATQKATPISAPVGGRSPTKRRGGILSRRRVGSSPFTRVEPPSFAKSGGGNGMPFSLDAALSGTVDTAPKPVSDLKDSTPSRWDFQIYEDSPEEELGNLVQHSTQTLDISDDESKTSERNDRGKENVPPADCTTLPPVARADIMTEEVRTPLGDLNTKDYFAPGCDEDSVIIIPGENEFTFEAPRKIDTSGDLLKEVLNKTSKLTTPITTPVEVKDTTNEIVKTEGPIQIYESDGEKES